MAANRIIDRQIDARNPRTASRELVTGAVSVRTAWTGAAVALVVFLVAAAAAQPALPGARAARAWCRWSSTRTASGSPTSRTRSWRSRRRSARSAPGWRSPAPGRLRAGLAARRGGRALDRRLRPDLRLPGRRDRPGRSACTACPPASACAFALHASTVAHVVTFGLFVWFGALVGLRLAVVDRAGADRGRVRLRAR